MLATVSCPSTLDSATLARRLADLAGEERGVQVEFLLHLDEFDRRRGWAEAGYPSLWEYCLRVLHLREGAAGRRIGAMRVLRRFPRLAPALREGRLCLSTASLLGQVLTDGNLDALVAQAAFKTKTEVEEMMVSLRPRTAPAEGVRRLPVSSPVAAPTQSAPPAAPEAPRGAPTVAGPDLFALPSRPDAAPIPIASQRRYEMQPVAKDRWSLRVTFGAAAKARLDELKALLSHKIPDGDLAAVLEEAILCAVEKHGRRRRANGQGAPSPALPKEGADQGGTGGHEPPEPRHAPRFVPAAIVREVWARDGGRCTYVGPDGHRCDSAWQVELDHVTPVARGGRAVTAADVRLRCRSHNILEAEHAFGREHMERFRGRVPQERR